MSSTNAIRADFNSEFVDNCIKIPGLIYIPECINSGEHDRLLDIIDQQIWSTELKRRVQHYGYRYDYQKRSVKRSMYLGALPEWVPSIATRLNLSGLTEKEFDQAIVNEYQPSQGRSSHIDCVSCFDDTIISLSLGSACVMEFTYAATRKKAPLLLLPKSVVVLQKAARYDWQHRIAPRKTDKYKDLEFVRTRRVSLTFRKVLGITFPRER